MPKKEIKQEIGFLNVILCLLVILIHVCSQAVTGLQKESAALFSVFMPWRLAAFVVQGFIFISAMKMMIKFKNAGRMQYGRFLLGRCKRILIPYILWVLVYYLYFCANGVLTFHIADLMRYMLIGDLVSPFYFIIVICQFYLLMPLWIKLIRKVHPAILIAVSILVTILFGQGLPTFFNRFHIHFAYNDRILTTYLAYWILGCLAGVNYEGFIKWLDRSKIILYISFAFIGMTDVFLSFYSFNNRLFIPVLETVHLIYCFLAIGCFYLLAVMFSERFKTPPILRWIDESAYYIYLSHSLVIFVISNWIVKNLGIPSIKMSLILKFILVYPITLFLCGSYVAIKKRYKHRIARASKQESA